MDEEGQRWGGKDCKCSSLSNPRCRPLSLVILLAAAHCYSAQRPA